MNASEGTRFRSKGWLVAALFVALIVLVAALVFIVGSDNSNSHDTTAPTPSTFARGDTEGGFGTPTTDILGRRVDLPLAAAGQPLSQTVTPVAESDPSWLTAAPAGTTGRGGWQRVYGVSVPFSTSDGPTQIRGGMAAGYARTPRGAALAAVYITHQLAARPADPAVVARVNYSAADLAAYRGKVADGTLPIRQPEAVTRWIVAPDAFQIVSWSPDLVVVKTASRRAPGTAEQAPTWTSVRYTVVWTRGDWNLLPGTEFTGSQEIASILGWTPW
ncbi:hypothetical protein [Nocardia sp. CDC160]|uniref:hypothetical protein n=1 Tax=Nocardia sp. CDC160 TaxID=3112166 RepID=UPI002DB55DEF|nr:hypothetical protein [Nocardia sp. CDC160]MEC3919316.1 hypothetical protein [Nocardia sp. CDC160]